MRQEEQRRSELNELGYNVHAFEEHVLAVTNEHEQDYLRSLQEGFFDGGSHPSVPYAPRLIYNDKESAQNVLSTLETEFKKCDRFAISVAFVTKDGVTVLMNTLLDLQERGIPGRVLVSTYLGFNDPDALAKLCTFSNIEVRVFEGPLHSKGYLFGSSKMCTIMVGSSNLTQSALLANSEWNLLVKSFERGAIWDSTQREFERLWESTHTRILDEIWLEEYRTNWKRVTSGRTFKAQVDVQFGDTIKATRRLQINPNKMQIEALSNLKQLRETGARRALLISSTGTGKTFLAAFDVAAVDPHKLLFVIHRERIAREAMASFARIVNPSHKLGLYSGNTRDRDCDYLFATVQSLARHLEDFDPHAFDYVILDEAHHVGAGSYQRIARHFEPRFMLGMTATPSRNDDFNVYDFFDNNIAYQITLQKAQEEEMLAPFHYFGIHDLVIEGEEIGDVTDFKRLTSKDRVDHVIEQLQCYAVDHVRRGLVFCSSIEEAHTLARMFTQRGYRSVALDGSSSDSEREDAIERLECDRSERDDWIEFIFTRDIFNEGVDIPSVNLIVMLRPTESAIIFVQQLGRGLRKCVGKDFVLVLDFIGNYKKSYLIPIALSGDRTYNKDNIRRFVQEGNRIIPGCSTINFDEVSEHRIYELLDGQKFGTIKFIRNEYTALKNMLGRIPSLMDFYQNGSIDLQLLFGNNSLGSYHTFLSKYEKSYTTRFTKTQEQMLRYVSQKLASGKRVQDLLLLRMLLETHSVSAAQYAQAVHDASPSLPVAACSVRSMLSGTFLTGGQANTFSLCKFLADGEQDFEVSDVFVQALEDDEFCRQLAEVVDYGIFIHGKRFADTYDQTSLVLYQKYTYEDVCDNGMRTFLFVRKNKNDAESKEFYYLGEMQPTGKFAPIVMAGTDKPAVEIEYDLLTPVKDELFDYLTSGEG